MEIIIPKEFAVLGEKYKVIISKDLILNGKNQCLGTVNFEKKVIKLTKGWQDVQLVLMHELSHVLDHLTGIGSDKADSEIFAKISSLFWFQIFKQLQEVKNGRRTNSTRTKSTSKNRSTKKK